MKVSSWGGREQGPKEDDEKGRKDPKKKYFLEEDFEESCIPVRCKGGRERNGTVQDIREKNSDAYLLQGRCQS